MLSGKPNAVWWFRQGRASVNPRRVAGVDASTERSLGGGTFLSARRTRTTVAVTYTCVCGATLRYKQDIERERGAVRSSWKCRDCGTPVPGRVAERIRHQHPS